MAHNEQEREEIEVRKMIKIPKKIEKISKKRLIISFVIMTILNIYLLNTYIYSLKFDGTEISYQSSKKVNILKNLLKYEYYKDVEEEKIIEGCMNGMANIVDDPYTVYFSKKDMNNFMEKAQGSYLGIGISVLMGSDGLLHVIDVFENSPAQEAGLKLGDKIIKVGSEDVTEMKDEFSIIEKIKGAEDTSVQITVFRPELNNEIEVTVSRKSIKLINVYSEVLDEKIGYIKLVMFDEAINTTFREHLDNLLEKNINSLIIDVRDNPGGDYEQVVKICNRLLPKDSLIVYTENKKKEQVKEYAKEDGLELPIIVLVNGNSASASEVLSAALKDNNKAQLVGNRTYGKGLVQSVVLFSDGSGVKLTTARYFTPSGECIQDKGIEPDYNVNILEQYKDYLISQIPREDDVQLKAAIDIIKSKI